MTSQEFISFYSKLASIGSLGTKILPSVTMAQAILESNWGKSALAIQGNNFFGIKADSSWHGPAIQLPTPHDSTPVSSFRKYRDASESFRDHVNFFYYNPRYSNNPATNVMDDTDPEQQCRDIAANHYAEDPAYADKLISIIRSNDLTTLDKKKDICEQVLEL
jgi:lysozyme